MQDGPTISNLPEGHNLITSTVVVTSPAATVTPGSPLVKVLIKYPADWKKDKFFKDGDIKEVSPETAATFVEIGIATMFNPEDASTTEVAEAAQEQLTVTLADPSVLEGSEVTGYEDNEGQASTETDASTTDIKKGGKKTTGK